MSALARSHLVAGLLALPALSLLFAQSAGHDRHGEAELLTNVRQVTFEGRRAGEGYFSPDGSRMIFQSEREPQNPFFQIYVMDLGTGDTHRVSTGVGRTTCSWIHSDGRRVLFASSHHDPQARPKQEAELKRRASGKERHRRWVYDEYYDIYVGNIDGADLKNVTNALGYDAEGSFSPDGTLIAFNSNRHAYDGELSAPEQERRQSQPEYFCDIYVMNADGSNVRRLTHEVGDDGGPFFSPDGKRICWRHFSEDGMRAEVWTMNVDGSDQRQITRLGRMSWAPFYHPSGKYLIFTSNVEGFPPNFELFVVDVDGTGDPVRVTWADSFDGLPAFMPDGKRLAWTCNHTANKQGQIFFADWNHAEACRQLGLGLSTGGEQSIIKRSARQPPATIADISAADIRTHTENLAVLLLTGGIGDAGSTQAVTEYIAVAFGRLGLEPAGDHATLFQFCEVPLLGGGDDEGDTREVGCNVLARLRADPASDRKALVIGAHVGPTEGITDLQNHVSGAAGMLEIAEYLTDRRDSGRLALKRDVVFAAFVGEPISAGFVTEGLGAIMKAEPGAPARIAAYLGLEEIGSLDGEVILSGVGSSPIWRREIERRNVPVGLRITTHDAPDPRTTSFHFYAGAVPALSVAAAGTSPSPQGTINDAGAERVTRLMALLARSLVSMEAAPAFTPVIERKGAGPGRPYLGTVPDFVGGDSGVKLTGVTQDSPAARAGLRPGDVIVQLNGKPIKDINAYAAVLDELPIGEETSVVVVRGDERVRLTVKVGSRR